MPQMFEAVFEHGVLRLLGAPDVPFTEGQHVRLVVDPLETPPADNLALAAQVYAGLSKEEIDEIEQIALERRAFFGDRTP
jgi:predicted DNA-binding antitoxin AbrB/MazE fold protein